jgi:hypothetical protein
MSSHVNHKRGTKRTQDHGPTWESHTPSAGCNSTHVARSRAAWKRLTNRKERRTGEVHPQGCLTSRKRPPSEDEDDDEGGTE